MLARELMDKLDMYGGKVKIVDGMLVAKTGYADDSYDILLKEDEKNKGDE